MWKMDNVYVISNVENDDCVISNVENGHYLSFQMWKIEYVIPKVENGHCYLKCGK